MSNSFAPEFGSTAGNIFNVITNSGANQLHGEFYFIGRPPDASARNLLTPSNKESASIDLHDYAVNASGAIVKDKLFIFGGYEHLLRALPVLNTINVASASQLGLAPGILDPAPAVQHAQFLNIRADWIINSKHQAFIRYNYFRNEYPFNTGTGGLNTLEAEADFHDRAHIIGLQVLSTFSPTPLNELRGSIPYRNEAPWARRADRTRTADRGNERSYLWRIELSGRQIRGEDSEHQRQCDLDQRHTHDEGGRRLSTE